MSRVNYLEKHIGGVLTTLLVSFLIGTVAMVYTSDKNNEVFKTQLHYISNALEDMKEKMVALEHSMQDRWRRTDQVEFSRQVDERFIRVYERMNELEKRLNEYHQQKHLGR